VAKSAEGVGGSSLAEVAELLDDSKRVASDHYVDALTDYAEVDRGAALSGIASAETVSCRV
jgi:hypothetical protein